MSAMREVTVEEYLRAGREFIERYDAWRFASYAFGEGRIYYDDLNDLWLRHCRSREAWRMTPKPRELIQQDLLKKTRG